MPQLDFTISFPQIFWLIVIFFVVYIFILHFFLPNFIKLIKTRKEVVLFNEKKFIQLKNNSVKKQFLINETIQRNFKILKSTFEKEFSVFLLKSSSINLHDINAKTAKILYDNIMYYNIVTLNLILKKLNLEI